LPRLDLLVTQQAPDRQDVARLRGIHRTTSGRWLAREAAGGLDALRATCVSPGTPISLAPAGLARLESALQRPAGVASDAALRPWGRQTHGGEVHDTTRYTVVRVRLKATRQVARPSPTKHP
jgi:hypothetical protein